MWQPRKQLLQISAWKQWFCPHPFGNSEDQILDHGWYDTSNPKKKDVKSKPQSKPTNSCWPISFQEANFLDIVFIDKWINPCFEALYTSYFLSWKFETWDSLRDSKQVYIFCMSILQEDFSARSLCIVASVLSSLSLAEDGEPEGGWEELVLQTCYLIGWTVAAGL